MALILHAGKTNKNAFKTLIAAEYSGVQVELAQNFEMGVSNKTPEFIKMNPIGKVPVLETPDGSIFESNAIARYVARLKSDNPLCGSSLTECAHVEQWIDFASLEVDANILNWFRPRMGHTVYLPPAEEAAISALKRGLGALNTYLASNTYLVGHAVTLADIIMTCNLYLGFTRLMTTSFTSEFPHVERYFWTMVNQANFSKILGEVKQTEKVPPVQSTKQPSPPKEAAKPKPKDEPKKEAKKEPAKPKEEAGEEEEEAPAPTCTLIFSPSRLEKNYTNIHKHKSTLLSLSLSTSLPVVSHMHFMIKNFCLFFLNQPTPSLSGYFFSPPDPL
ncbi:unnamed protein product [Camellia sinensis]